MISGDASSGMPINPKNERAKVLVSFSAQRRSRTPGCAGNCIQAHLFEWGRAAVTVARTAVQEKNSEGDAALHAFILKIGGGSRVFITCDGKTPLKG